MLAVNISVVTATLSGDSVPLVRAALSAFSVAIQNIMACRVFRLLRFGQILDDPTSATIFPHNIVPRSAHLTLIRSSSLDSLDDINIDHPDCSRMSHGTVRSPNPGNVQISVCQEVEEVVDPDPGEFSSSSDLGHGRF